MTNKKIYFLLPIIISLFLFFAAPFSSVWASVMPTLTLSATNNSMAQITVYGDPNSTVELHYGNGASLVNTMGTTDQNGSFTTPVSVSSYNLNCGSTAYVVINGQKSVTIPWQITGTTCSNLSFSQTNVNLTIGQSASVAVNGTTSLMISSNPTPSVASASINNGQVFITGLSYGTDNIIACINDSNNLCGTIFVSVQNGTSSVYLSQNNVSLGLNQTQIVTVSGTGPFSISSNSAPSSIPAGLSGNTVTLYGGAVGASTIVVCQTGGGCATLYASVTGSVSTADNQDPAISSFSVSTNNPKGRFSQTGDFLTFNFTTSEPVVNPTLTINGQKLFATGSGIGPYVATYTVTGNESRPLTVLISAVDLANNATSFAASLAQSILTPTAIASVSVPKVEVLSSKTAFKSFLSVGSSGREVEKLQELLKSEGFYKGSITSYYGSLTEKAVKLFQKAHGIKQAGYVGPSTREALNSLD